MWNGSKGSFSPWGLKQEIGKYQSMVFSFSFFFFQTLFISLWDIANTILMSS